MLAQSTANPKTPAQQAYELGLEQKNAKNYSEAISSFLKAYLLTRHKWAMENLGLTEFTKKKLNLKIVDKQLTVEDMQLPADKLLIQGLVLFSGIDDKNSDAQLGCEKIAKSAKKGCTDAQWLMGIIFKELAFKDKENADKYFEYTNYYFNLAANQHHANTQNSLGFCYEKGIGVSKNHETAIKYFQLAADQGLAEAQNNLGVCYDNGIGVIKNQETAIKYFQLAADQGLADAQKNLGICYEHGKGVIKNQETAIKYYQLAADQGLADAQNNLGVCYEHGIGVIKNQETAIKYYQLAANKGCPKAQTCLGYCYKNGRGVPKNLVTAKTYFELAANQGFANAQLALGICYEYGNGVIKNWDSAALYYKLAADQKNKYAQYNLGLCYQYGMGVAQDLSKAVECYKLAAEHGHPKAQYTLGFWYQHGTNDPQDLQKAATYFYEAFIDGDVDLDQQRHIMSFLSTHNHYYLVELKKIVYPIEYVELMVKDSIKNRFATSDELMALLRDPRTSKTLLENQDAVDLIASHLFQSATQQHFKENLSESDMYQAITYYYAIPQNSIFYPFVLDSLLSFKNEANEEERKEIIALRKKIKEITCLYYPDKEMAESTAEAKQIPKKQLTVKQKELLDKQKLTLESVHNMNKDILTEMITPPTCTLFGKKRKLENDAESSAPKKQKTEEQTESLSLQEILKDPNYIAGYSSF